MSTASRVAERLAQRSRFVTTACLMGLALLAWAYLFSGAGMSAMAGPASGFVFIAAMWWVMMVAMMVPAAAPTILLYARVHRHSDTEHAPAIASFLAGYLACWLGFALIVAGLQLWLIPPMSMALADRGAAGAVMIAVGIYQISPFKDACLSHCRSPAQFLTRHYRPGPSGAFRLGLLHGAYCLGCCWLLMGLLFVGGVMNLLWVAGLALLVAGEKLLPGGQWLAKIAGVGLLVWGVVLVFG